jgi:hypothetical protein
VAQSEIVHAFLEGTTCRDLVRELGRSPPVDSNELFDIATSFASGEEAMGAIFDGKKGKRMDDAPSEGSGSKEPQQKHKRGKKGKKPHREARAPRRDNNGDKALAVDPARWGPRAAPRGPSVFDDMLKKPCPYHKTPVNHTLEQCDLLKRYYSRAAAKDGEAKKDGGDGDSGGFPAVENVFVIFGGPTVDMSNSQRKRERHEVLAAEKAPPSFLDWSEDAITFSCEDDPNRIPNPGQYPLVVDPVIGNARFSKLLMDGGSSLNNLYAPTLRLLGIRLDQLRPSTTSFHCVAPRQARPAPRADRPACLVWHARQLPQGNPHLRGGGVQGHVPHHSWAAVLRQVHGSPELHLPQDEDARTQRRHHRGLVDRAHVRLDVECVEHAEALALDEALVTNLEKLVNENLDSAAKHAGSFEAAEQTKGVPLDPAAPESKALRVSSTLGPK